MQKSTDLKDAAGRAALAICESLLLALIDLKMMGEKDARDFLEDAAAVHRDADAVTQDAAVHREVVSMIERIISSVRATSRS